MAHLWRLGAVAGLGALLLSGCGTKPVALSRRPVPESLRTRASEVTDQTARVNLLPGTPLGLDAVAFANTTDGWVAGNGVIMGTSDSGDKWATEYLGPQAITSLDVLSPTLAWALGGTALLRTTDGGRKWADVSSVNNLSQKDAVDFVNAHTGYGLIGRMNAQGSMPLMRTRNGGATWQRSLSGIQATAIAFSGADSGWALVPFGAQHVRLEYTRNAGQSWAVQMTVGDGGNPMSGGVLVAEGHQDAWALIDGGAGMSQQSYTLFHTTDAGANWEAVTSRETENGPGPGDPQGVPAGPGSSPGPLAAVNGSSAVLMGICEACQAAGTADLGRISQGTPWQNHPAPIPEASGPLSMAFPSLSDGWIAQSPGVGVSDILATADGGASWHEQFRYTMAGPTDSIAFVSRTLGFGIGSVGNPSAVLKTTDGGRSWTEIGNVAAAENQDVAVSFPTPRQGWAIAQSGQLYKTADGGKNWEAKQQLNAHTPFTAIDFLSVRVGYAKTTAGYWVTRDGGAIWSPSRSLSGLLGFSLKMPPGTAGQSPALAEVKAGHNVWVDSYGPSSNGDLWHTSDGGKQWTRYAWNIPAGVDSLSFLNRRDGWMLMPGNALLQTTNGGLTWRQLP